MCVYFKKGRCWVGGIDPIQTMRNGFSISGKGGIYSFQKGMLSIEVKREMLGRSYHISWTLQECCNGTVPR